jgi:ABC-type bacteriocin/lantibiotic exporter with double-glycine peptidase domain
METPFEGTVLENITFKNATVSEETLKWAIEGMQLKEFIKSLPQGLDTALFQKENSCHRLMLKNITG